MTDHDTWARFSDLSSADSVDLVALGSEQGPDGRKGRPRVGVWSATDGSMVMSMDDPEYSVGGRRLAISTDGRLVASASWTGGVTAHVVSSGRRLWHNRNLRQCGRLGFSLTGGELILIRQSGDLPHGGLAIGSDTGEPTRSLGPCDYFAVFARSETWLCSRSDHQYAYLLTRTGVERWRTRTATPHRLSSASSSEVIVLAEPGVGLRVLSIVTGEQIRRVDFPEFVRHLSYIEHDDQFACWISGTQAGSDRLLIVSKSGSVVSDRHYGAMSALGFFRRGEAVVDYNGAAWDWRTGQKLFDFEWPF